MAVMAGYTLTQPLAPLHAFPAWKDMTGQEQETMAASTRQVVEEDAALHGLVISAAELVETWWGTLGMGLKVTARTGTDKDLATRAAIVDGCSLTGHKLTVEQSHNGAPTAVVCTQCGQEWPVGGPR
jgi:hypothetical protein